MTLTIMLYVLAIEVVLIVLELARLWWIERHTDVYVEDDGPSTWFDDHDDFKRIGR